MSAGPVMVWRRADRRLVALGLLLDRRPARRPANPLWRVASLSP